MDETVHITRDEIYAPTVDATLAHQKALVRQTQPPVEESTTPLRRVLLSNVFYTPLAGLVGALITTSLFEPWMNEATANQYQSFNWLLLPIMNTLIVISIFISDGIASRRLPGNLDRWIKGALLTLIFSFLAQTLGNAMLLSLILVVGAPSPDIIMQIQLWPALFIIAFVIWRTLAWTTLGLAMGWAMNLSGSTRAQRRASTMGGAVGGALGGLLFDPINRFMFPAIEEGSIMRMVAFSVVGLCLGLFVALSERLGREGWVRVRTGPLRGKAFILYHDPTIIGSSPRANIYLFKDPKVAPEHAALHRAGSGYDLVRESEGAALSVNGVQVQRRRLISGDQIAIGDTILHFEERARKQSIKLAIKEVES